jgi:pSer/pThr/pTyr-binding forkhead associated (FHA) protein
MPVLTLYADQKKLKSYKLRPEQPLTIGRHETNAIVLDDPAVSGSHAEIECDGRQYFITDYQSRNGTFVNKELVISRQLAHGDRITINPYTLVFAYLRGEQADAGNEEKMQATMHIDTSDHRSRLAKSLSEISGTAADPSKAPCLEFLNGDRPPVFLSESTTRIGKSEQCDIVVKGWMVGQTAAEIKAADEGYVLYYVSGARKPRVNYKPIAHEVALNEFDIIEVGATGMQLHYRKPEGESAEQQTREIEMGSEPDAPGNPPNPSGNPSKGGA